MTSAQARDPSGSIPLTIIREPSPRRVRNIFITWWLRSALRPRTAPGQSPPARGGGAIRHACLDTSFDHTPVHEVIERVIDGK
jgi:hypothetical protein